MRDRYDITLLGPETTSPKGTTVLSLRPKQPEGNVIGIQVWVDDKTGLPVQYIVKEKGAVTTVTLSNVKTTDISPKIFEIDIPSGVKRVQG